MKTTFRLLALLKPLLGWVALSAFLGAATVASSIGLLGTSAYLIAKAALHPSIALLQVSIVGVRFFGISRGVFRYLERLVSHSVNFRLLAQFRSRFYKDIEPLAPARLMDYHSGDLLGRVMGDIEVLDNFYVRAVAPPVVAGMMTIAVGFFVGQFNPKIGALLAAGLLISGAGVPFGAYFAGRRMGKKIIVDKGNLGAALVDGIQGLGDLLANGQGTSKIYEIRQRSERLGRAQKMLGLGTGLTNGINLLITQLTLWVILCYAIKLVGTKQLEGVLLPVIALIVLASFEAVNPLGTAAQYLQSSLEAAKRLFELSDSRATIIEPARPLPVPKNPWIRFSHLTFRYDLNSQPVLNDFCLDLPEGIHTALIGTNGSGKSTIVNLLQRFWDYDFGSIQLNGCELKDLSSYDIRRTIGVKPQSIYLFSGTVAENLQMAQPGAADKVLIAALRKACLMEWLDNLPQGLNTWIGEHGLKLSGGERQRLAIARTLLRDSPIVILDEPTEHLELFTEMALVRELQLSLRERTVLWISHRLTGLEKMDQIVVLKNGRVLEQGRHEVLIQSGGTYARIWALHTQEI